MRYVKVLLLVLVFFLSMVFFFQNQEALSKEMVLKLHLFFSNPMTSIPLPFYFLILASFLMGALVTMFVLVWDKFHLSARLMKATWRVRALEKDLSRMAAEATAAATPAPPAAASTGLKFFSRNKPKADIAQPAAEMPAEDMPAADKKA